MAAEIPRVPLEKGGFGIVGDTGTGIQPQAGHAPLQPVLSVVVHGIRQPLLRDPGPGFPHARRLQNQPADAVHQRQAGGGFHNILEHHGRHIGIGPGAGGASGGNGEETAEA